MRRGVTVLELIVVLAILGVMAAVVAATWRTMESAPSPGSLASARIRLVEARREAITRGVSVTVTIDLDSAIGQSGAPGKPHRVQSRATALPDGSILADRPLGIERLTGRPIGSWVR